MDYSIKYTYIRNIGKGAFGKDYSGEANLIQENNTEKLYISKRILTSNMSNKEAEKVHQEAELMKRFAHQHIVEYQESFITPSDIIIIMEYCQGGDLTQLINYHKKINSFFPESTIFD